MRQSSKHMKDGRDEAESNANYSAELIEEEDK